MAHSSYLSTYRLDNYSPRLHMSVYQPPVIIQTTINGTPSTPVTEIDIDTPLISGSLNFDPYLWPHGYQVIIRDPVSEHRKAVGRLSFSSVIGGTTWTVRDISAGAGVIADGDLIEVVAYMPLDTLLVSSDASLNPDDVAANTKGLHPMPYGCCGGAWAGWADESTGIAQVYAVGSTSQIYHPSDTDLRHKWINFTTSFHSGSVDTDADPIFDVPVGHHLVMHQATNYPYRYSNNFVPYIVHNKDNPPYEVILKDYAGDVERGINWKVEVLSDSVTEEDIPELALCILWVDDYFGNTGLTNLNRTAETNRSHIIGIGYARRVISELDGEDGLEHIEFEIQSAMSRLGEIANYSKVMVEGYTLDDWTQIDTLGFQRGLAQLFQYYTTLSLAGFDFVVHDSWSDARYPAFYLQRSNPVAQMRELADARNGRLVMSHAGARFELQTHPALVELGDRP